MLSKSKAKEVLSALLVEIPRLRTAPRGSREHKQWWANAKSIVANLFDENSRQFKQFSATRFALGIIVSGTPEHEHQAAYVRGLDTAEAQIRALVSEIDTFWPEGEVEKPTNALQTLALIFSRFHLVALQMRRRYGDRDTLKIQDEYDVQDLLHALLKLHFEDVRPEEAAPSVAGKSSRLDFLLKKERIVIEVKKTGQSVGQKEVGDQLIIDSKRYQSHPDCETLVCFVYDPDQRIPNPHGLEKDLRSEVDGFCVEAFIFPK